MTKEEVKAFLDNFGIKVDEVTDEIAEKVEAEKAKLDTETRRKVRSFWLAVLALSVAVSLGLGTML